MAETYVKLIVNIRNPEIQFFSAKIRSSHSHIFFKISVPKSLAKFTGVFV